MSVRRLVMSDLPLLAEGGRLFFAEGKLPVKFSAAHFQRCWETYLDQGIGAVFGLFRDGCYPDPEAGKIEGALGAILFPSPFGGELMAVEQFWYMLPDCRGNGLKLLREFERWAIAAGAEHACMIHLIGLQPEALGQLYERRGYRKIEVNYIKDLTGQPASQPDNHLARSTS